MPGLIDLAMKDNTKTNVGVTDVYGATATGYDSKQRSVDEAKETVSGQFDRLMKEDSTLMQQARTASDQQMNRRGLVNSSMGATAAMDSAARAALPIATADAQTYTLASRDNQNADNQSRQFNAGEMNVTSRFNTGEQNQVGKMNLGADLEKQMVGIRTDASSRLQGEQAVQQQQLQAQRGAQEQALATQRTEAERGLQTQRGEQDVALQTLRGTQAESLARIETANRTLLQSSQQAASLYSDIQRQIAAVQADTNLSTEQKQAAMNALTRDLETGLALFGGTAGVDIRGLLNFSGGQATPAANAANPVAGATGGTAGNYLADTRLKPQADALKAAMQQAGVTTLSQAALANPAVAQAYNALNTRVNALNPGNSYSLMNDFRP